MIRFAAAAAILAISACASQPEPCTPEWAQWKAEKLLTPFAIKHRGFLRDLRKMEGQFDNPSLLAIAQIARIADDAGDVIEDFRTEVMPEFQLAYQQCGSVEKLMPTFTKFLRQEGVDDTTIKWIEGLAAFVEAVQPSN